MTNIDSAAAPAAHKTHETLGGRLQNMGRLCYHVTNVTKATQVLVCL